MTLPPRAHPPRWTERTWHEPLVGDRPRFSFVTRILFEDPDLMPLDAAGGRKNAAAGIDNVTGEYVLLLRNDLDVATRRAAIKKLRADLRHAGASRLTAWWLLTIAGIHQLGFTYLRMRAGGAAQDAWALIWDHLGGTAVVAAAALGTGIAATAAIGGGGGVAVGSPRWHQLHPVHVTLPEKPLSYLGVYEQASPYSYSGVQIFARTCGREPNVVSYYSGWEEKFQAQFAAEAARHGAIPLVQIDPVLYAAPGVPGAPVSLLDIAGGSYDDYLVRFADQVASYRHAVIIGFGHEMNGSWYSWGYGHQSPASFVAAWQHIVNVFRRQGADNVTWLWTVNKISASTGPLSSYWPGAAYVTWVGVDAYYQNPGDTWGSVFAPTIAAVQAITGDGILLAETGIGPTANEVWQLQEMYAYIRQNHKLLGLAWFDVNKPPQFYRLEGDPRDSAVFRQLTRPWRLQQQLKATAGA